MIVIVSFPLTDLRMFTNGAQRQKLARPSWPAPDTSREFIRGFGAVRNRPMGGMREWASEDVFTDASNAVKIDPSSADRTGRVRIVFRRLFTDGGPVSRLDIGVAIRTIDKLDSTRLFDLVRDVCKLKVKIGDFANTLIQAGTAIAGTYFLATNRQGRKRNNSSLVVSGPPLAFVILRANEERGLTIAGHHRLIAPRPGHPSSIRVCHEWITMGSHKVSSWLLQPQDREGALFGRDLRVHLSRLNAEKEGLLAVTRAVATGEIKVKRGTDESEELQDYFLQTAQLVDKLDNAELLDSFALAHIASSVSRLGSTRGTIDLVKKSMDALGLRRQVVQRVLTSIERIWDAEGANPAPPTTKETKSDSTLVAADIIILTAITLEFEAVLKVSAGQAKEDAGWILSRSADGLPIAKCTFVGRGGRPLRILAAQAGSLEHRTV